MQVGVGHTVRDYCVGQSLASLGLWPVAARRLSRNQHLDRCRGLVPKVLTTLRHQDTLDGSCTWVEAMPFPAQDVALRKDQIIAALYERGFVTAEVGW